MKMSDYGLRLPEPGWSDNILVCIINQKLFKAIYFSLSYAHGCIGYLFKLVSALHREWAIKAVVCMLHANDFLISSRL